MIPDTLCSMTFQLGSRSMIFQAKFTNVDFGQSAEVVRVWTLIPDFHLKATHFKVPSLSGVRQASHMLFDDFASISLSLTKNLQIPLRGETSLKMIIRFIKNMGWKSSSRVWLVHGSRWRKVVLVFST